MKIDILYKGLLIPLVLIIAVLLVLVNINYEKFRVVIVIVLEKICYQCNQVSLSSLCHNELIRKMFG